MTSASAPATIPDPRRWKALGVLALIQFMLILDVTVVNVALPQIQADLDFTRAGLAWVVDGYVLAAGGLLLLGGRLADVFGRKRLFLIGVAIFASPRRPAAPRRTRRCSSSPGSCRASARRSPRLPRWD